MAAAATVSPLSSSVKVPERRR